MQCSDNPIEQRGDWSCKLGEGGLQCRSGERNTVDKQREIQLKRTEKYSLDDDQNIVDNVIWFQAVQVCEGCNLDQGRMRAASTLVKGFH